MASTILRRLLSQPQAAAALAAQACGSGSSARPFQLVQLAAFSASVSGVLARSDCYGSGARCCASMCCCRHAAASRPSAAAADICGHHGRLISSRTDSHLQAAAAAAGPASGKLFGVCVLERLPVVVPEDPDWELEYRAWQAVRGAKRREAACCRCAAVWCCWHRMMAPSAQCAAQYMSCCQALQHV